MLPFWQLHCRIPSLSHNLLVQINSCPCLLKLYKSNKHNISISIVIIFSTLWQTNCVVLQTFLPPLNKLQIIHKRDQQFMWCTHLTNQLTWVLSTLHTQFKPRLLTVFTPLWRQYYTWMHMRMSNISRIIATHRCALRSVHTSIVLRWDTATTARWLGCDCIAVSQL